MSFCFCMHIYSTAIFSPITGHFILSLCICIKLNCYTVLSMVLNQQGVGVLSLITVSYSIPPPLCCISCSLQYSQLAMTAWQMAMEMLVNIVSCCCLIMSLSCHVQGSSIELYVVSALQLQILLYRRHFSIYCCRYQICCVQTVQFLFQVSMLAS